MRIVVDGKLYGIFDIADTDIDAWTQVFESFKEGDTFVCPTQCRQNSPGLYDVDTLTNLDDNTSGEFPIIDEVDGVVTAKMPRSSSFTLADNPRENARVEIRVNYLRLQYGLPPIDVNIFC